MGRFKAGPLLALLALGLAALWLLGTEGHLLHSPRASPREWAETSRVGATDPVRYLCLGHGKIDLESPLSTWSSGSERDFYGSMRPCDFGQLPSWGGTRMIVAASTASRTSSVALIRMAGGCEFLEKGLLGTWKAIETSAKDETFAGIYRRGSSAMNAICWRSGKGHGLALLVLSHGGR